MHIQYRLDRAVGVVLVPASEVPCHWKTDGPAGLENGTIPTAQLVVVKPTAAQFIVDVRIGAQLHEQQVTVDEGLDNHGRQLLQPAFGGAWGAASVLDRQVKTKVLDDFAHAVRVVLVEVEQADTHAGQVRGSDGNAVQATEAAGVSIASMVKAGGRTDGPDAVAQCFLSGGEHTSCGVWQAGGNSPGAIAEAIADLVVEQGIHERWIMCQLDLVAGQRFEVANVEWDAELLPAFDSQCRLGCGWAE
jgi:hypothetical protein